MKIVRYQSCTDLPSGRQLSETEFARLEGDLSAGALGGVGIAEKPPRWLKSRDSATFGGTCIGRLATLVAAEA